MVTRLFQPFNLSLWFGLGFSAWLANLSGGFSVGSSFLGKSFFKLIIFLLKSKLSSGNGQGVSFPLKIVSPSLNGMPFQASQSLQPLLDKLKNIVGTPMSETMVIVIFAIVVIVIFATIVIGLLVAWIKARGEFIFIDNIVCENVEIINPWKKFSSLGNSVFLWRLVIGSFSLIMTTVIIGIGIVLNMAWVKSCIASKSLSWPDASALGGIVVVALGLAAVSLIIGFVNMIFSNFAIPVMYARGLNSLQAFIFVLGRIKSSIGAFILYFVFVFIISIFIFLTLYSVNLVTCGIAGLLLAIPYIGIVITLPLLFFLRAFSLEFVGQINGFSDFRLYCQDSAK